MTPLKPDQFIGKTGVIAASLFRRLEALPRDADPKRRRWLFTGARGVGKSTLAYSLGVQGAGHPLGVELINGQDCTVEKVREWMGSRAYGSLFGQWRVQIVDEIDQAKTDAVGQLRTYLDWLHPGLLFIATTNKAPKDLAEPLQSRFAPQYFDKVPASTIAQWLQFKFQIAAQLAMDIARTVDGDVRAAETDALNHLETLATV